MEIGQFSYRVRKEGCLPFQERDEDGVQGTLCTPQDTRSECCSSTPTSSGDVTSLNVNPVIRLISMHSVRVFRRYKRVNKDRSLRAEFKTTFILSSMQEENQKVAICSCESLSSYEQALQLHADSPTKTKTEKCQGWLIDRHEI